jgi:nicotinamidase-related amidase
LDRTAITVYPRKHREIKMNKAMRRSLSGLAFSTIAALAIGSAHAQAVTDEWASVKAPTEVPELKAVTLDAKKTALLVMDFNKNNCIPSQRPRCATALPKIQKILAQARAKGMMVVFTITTRMKQNDIASDVLPKAGERVLVAPVDKFTDNDLAKTLKNKGIDTVITAGTSANGAVLFTAAGAVLRGFKVVAPVDAMPADGAYQEQFVVWELAHAPTVSAGVTLTKLDMIKF